MSEKDTHIIDDIVDYHTLTSAQLILVRKANDLEQQYGKGNIFLRYIPVRRGIMFIVQYYGVQEFTILGGSAINQRIIHSLENKGLAIRCDTLHKKIIDTNDYKHRTDASYLGVRICTERVNLWDIK